MFNVNLGTLYASIQLNLSSLVAQSRSAQVLLGQVAATANMTAAQQATAASKSASSQWQAAQATALVGRAMSDAGRTVLGFSTAIIKTGLDFEHTMSRMRGNTGLTTNELKDFRKTVIEVGRDSASGLTPLANAMDHIANYGYRGQAAKSILEMSNRAAIGTGADVKDIARLVARTMNQFNIKGPNAAHSVMNTLLAATQQGDMNFKEFIKSSAFATTAGANVGLSLPETLAADSMLSRDMNPYQSATQVRGFTERVIKPSASTFKVAKALTNWGKPRGLPNLMHDMTPTGLGEVGIEGFAKHVRQYAAASKIPIKELTNLLVPGARGGLGFTALADRRFDTFSAFKKSNTEAFNHPTGKGDLLTPAYKDGLKDFQTQSKIMKTNLEALGAEAAKSLLPMLSQLVQHVTKLVQAFNTLPPGIKTNIVMFTIAAGAGMLLLGNLMQLVAGFATVAALMANAGITGTGLAAVWATITATLGTTGAALAAVAWPITLIIAAIALLALAWRNNWGHIREHTQSALRVISSAVTSAAREISTVWTQVSTQLGPLFRELWDAFSAAIKTGNSAWKAAWDNIRLVATGAWNTIAGVVKTVWAVIAGVVIVGLDLLTGHWKKAGEDIKKYGKMAWEGIVQIFKGQMQILQGAVMAAGSLLSAAFASILNTIFFIFKGGWVALVGYSRVGLQNIVRAVTSFGPALFNAGRSLIGTIGNGIRSGANGLSNATHDTLNAIGTLLPHSDAKTGPLSRLRAAGIAVPATLADGMNAGKHHVDRAGRHMAAEAKKHAKAMQKAAEEARDAIAAAYNDIFKLTHTPTAGANRDALNQFYEDKKSGVPIGLATERLKQNAKKNLKDLKDSNREISNEVFRLTHNEFDAQRREAGQKRDDDISSGKDPNVVRQRYRLIMEKIQADQLAYINENIDEETAGLAKSSKDWKENQQKKVEDLHEALLACDEEMRKSFDSNKELDDQDKKEEENLMKFKFDMHLIDFQSFMSFLRAKLSATQRWSEEWRKYYKEGVEAQRQHDSDEGNKGQGEQKIWGHKVSGSTLKQYLRSLKEVSRAGTQIFEQAFTDLFEHGPKRFFANVVDGFKKMLIKMLAELAAKAVIFGLLSIFTGGGLTNFMSFGSFLKGGFDDAGNDAMAKHWGWDFGDHFSQGVNNFNNQRDPYGRAARDKGGNVGHSTVVNFYDTHVHNDMDVRSIGEQLAWHAQNGLRQKVGAG